MTKESQRYWLTFSAERVQQPLIWQMSRKFEIVSNVRSAQVLDELGLIALELAGERKILGAAVKWLRRQGVQVDPIELGVLES